MRRARYLRQRLQAFTALVYFVTIAGFANNYLAVRFDEGWLSSSEATLFVIQRWPIALGVFLFLVGKSRFLQLWMRKHPFLSAWVAIWLGHSCWPLYDVPWLWR